jgi:hypothetical protein
MTNPTWIWRSQQFTSSFDGGDGYEGTEDFAEFPKSLAMSQSDDPAFLAIMEDMEEPTLGDSDKEDDDGEEVPEEDDDDDDEEEEKEEPIVPLAEEAPTVGDVPTIP